MGHFSNGRADGRDGLSGCVDHPVEGLDDRGLGPVDLHPDWENYINGNLQFALEYVWRGWAGGTKQIGGYWPHKMPTDVAFVLAEANLDVKREVRHALSPDLGAAQECVVCYWGQKSVLVPTVEIINQPEKLVPSRIRVWPKAPDCLDEVGSDTMGESLRYGFVKPVRFSAKRKLDGSLFVPGHVGGDDFPKGVIQCGPKVVDHVTADYGCLVYDGFVLFGERGAFAGLCICLNDVREGALLCEKLGKILDVFRGPLNLEGCAIGHG